MPKLKTTKNKAKDVETKPPKLKSVDIPIEARSEIALRLQNIDTFIAGVVMGLGIKGKWTFDQRRMKILVEKKENG